MEDSHGSRLGSAIPPPWVLQEQGLSCRELTPDGTGAPRAPGGAGGGLSQGLRGPSSRPLLPPPDLHSRGRSFPGGPVLYGCCCCCWSSQPKSPALSPGMEDRPQVQSPRCSGRLRGHSCRSRKRSWGRMPPKPCSSPAPAPRTGREAGGGQSGAALSPSNPLVSAWPSASQGGHGTEAQTVQVAEPVVSVSRSPGWEGNARGPPSRRPPAARRALGLPAASCEARGPACP